MNVLGPLFSVLVCDGKKVQMDANSLSDANGPLGFQSESSFLEVLSSLLGDSVEDGLSGEISNLELNSMKQALYSEGQLGESKDSGVVFVKNLSSYLQGKLAGRGRDVFTKEEDIDEAVESLLCLLMNLGEEDKAKIMEWMLSASEEKIGQPVDQGTAKQVLDRVLIQMKNMIGDLSNDKALKDNVEINGDVLVGSDEDKMSLKGDFSHNSEIIRTDYNKSKLSLTDLSSENIPESGIKRLVSKMSAKLDNLRDGKIKNRNSYNSENVGRDVSLHKGSDLLKGKFETMIKDMSSMDQAFVENRKRVVGKENLQLLENNRQDAVGQVVGHRNVVGQLFKDVSKIESIRNLGDKPLVHRFVGLQIADKVKQLVFMRKIPGGIQMRLFPPQLGQVRIDLRYENDGILRVSLLPEKIEAHHILKDVLSHLKEHLMEALKIDDVKIELNSISNEGVVPDYSLSTSHNYNGRGGWNNPFWKGYYHKFAKTKSEEDFGSVFASTVNEIA